jgi:hypothetical protein
MSNMTILWPCNRNNVWLTCDWDCHLRRPGYKAQYAGTDLAGAEQPLTPSQYNGKLLQAMWSTLGYGYTTYVEYYDQEGNAVLRIRNAHQKDLRVKVGDIVNPGDVLGTMDSTGNSTGTHTHWEVWIKVNGLWQNIDPLNPRFNVTIVGDQSALVPLDGSTPPPVPVFEIPGVELPIVKNTSPYQIRLRTAAHTGASAIQVGTVMKGSEWEYCGSTVDGFGNLWYAIKKGDKLGWSAAQYQGETWIEPVDDLLGLKAAEVKNITNHSINMRSFPFVSSMARITGRVYPNEQMRCYGAKTDTLGNVWFVVGEGDRLGWSAAFYNGDKWIVMVEG